MIMNTTFIIMSPGRTYPGNSNLIFPLTQVCKNTIVRSIVQRVDNVRMLLFAVNCDGESFILHLSKINLTAL